MNMMTIIFVVYSVLMIWSLVKVEKFNKPIPNDSNVFCIRFTGQYSPSEKRHTFLNKEELDLLLETYSQREDYQDHWFEKL